MANLARDWGRAKCTRRLATAAAPPPPHLPAGSRFTACPGCAARCPLPSGLRARHVTGPAVAGVAARLLSDAGRHGHRRRRESGRGLSRTSPTPSNPGCLINIDRQRGSTPWVDVPPLAETGHACPDGHRLRARRRPVRLRQSELADGQRARGRVNQGRLAAAAHSRRTRRTHDRRRARRSATPTACASAAATSTSRSACCPRSSATTGCSSAASTASASTTSDVAVTNTLADPQPAGHASSRRTAIANTAPTGWCSTARATCSSAISATVLCTRSPSTPQGASTGNDRVRQDRLGHADERPDFRQEDGPGQDAHDRRHLHRRRRTTSTSPISRTTPICKVDPQGRITVLAQSPDCDGSDGGLDQPGEPILWDGKLVVTCFDMVTGPDKVNTKHDRRSRCVSGLPMSRMRRRHDNLPPGPRPGHVRQQGHAVHLGRPSGRQPHVPLRDAVTSTATGPSRIPDDWWRAVCTTTQQLLAGRRSRPRSPAWRSSGQMMGCTPVDRAGPAPAARASSTAISGPRPRRSTSWQRIAPADFYRIVGPSRQRQLLAGKADVDQGPRAGRVSPHAPARCAPRTTSICGSPASAATDYSDASGTNAFDLNTLLLVGRDPRRWPGSTARLFPPRPAVDRHAGHDHRRGGRGDRACSRARRWRSAAATAAAPAWAWAASSRAPPTTTWARPAGSR